MTRRKSLFDAAFDTAFDFVWWVIDGENLKGRYGERRIARRLEGKTFPSGMLGASGPLGTCVRNVYVPLPDGAFSEVDVALVNEKGLFVIESKNYSGWTVGAQGAVLQPGEAERRPHQGASRRPRQRRADVLGRRLLITLRAQEGACIGTDCGRLPAGGRPPGRKTQDGRPAGRVVGQANRRGLDSASAHGQSRRGRKTCARRTREGNRTNGQRRGEPRGRVLNKQLIERLQGRFARRTGGARPRCCWARFQLGLPVL